jgi:transposase
LRQQLELTLFNPLEAHRSPTSPGSAIAAPIIIGYTGDVARFRSRDHFAAYTGTAPSEVSSGGRITHRLSRRGNRKLNHAIHLAAITQIRFAHSPGQAFFERKVAEGKTKKEAIRTLKRRMRRRLPTPPRQRRGGDGPGRTSGDGSAIQRGRLNTPTADSSDQPLPGPNQR